MFVNQREVCQKLVALPYVHPIHGKYVKIHEQHYLTYIQMIDILLSQKGMHTTYPVIVHKRIEYDTQTQFVM